MNSLEPVEGLITFCSPNILVLVRMYDSTSPIRMLVGASTRDFYGLGKLGSA
jgi:hypothetical protein